MDDEEKCGATNQRCLSEVTPPNITSTETTEDCDIDQERPSTSGLHNILDVTVSTEPQVELDDHMAASKTSRHMSMSAEQHISKKRFPKRSYRGRTVDDPSSSSSLSSSPVYDPSLDLISRSSEAGPATISVSPQLLQRQPSTDSGSSNDFEFRMYLQPEEGEQNDDMIEDFESDGSEIYNLDDEANLSEDTEMLKEVLRKPKPPYRWNAVQEFTCREQGLDRNGRSLSNGIAYGFNKRFHASRHVVERMKMSHCMRRHNGCVNCLNFNRTGELLCSGSDDLRIAIWNWSRNKIMHVFKSGHSDNVYQTKFIDTINGLNIVSSSRDGQVRIAIVPPSGGKVQSSCIYKHRAAVHKIVVTPQTTNEIISVGEDGYIYRKDMRTDSRPIDILKRVTDSKKRRTVQLFSVSHHPLAPEICVCGDDKHVRVYDKRQMHQPVHEMCPEHMSNSNMPQVTSCVYDNTGNEILASYNEHIYLFNNREYKSGEYLHRYRGHYNLRTIKGVNFFGPNSEYVISGSDCGNVFFWDKTTEAILNVKEGDAVGIVNCLETHPKMPVLTTSGLDHSIKLWLPINDQYPPRVSSKMVFCVKQNLRRSEIETEADFADRQLSYLLGWQVDQSMSNTGDESDDSSNGMWHLSSNSNMSSDNDSVPESGGPQHYNTP